MVEKKKEEIETKEEPKQETLSEASQKKINEILLKKAKAIRLTEQEEQILSQLEAQAEAQRAALAYEQAKKEYLEKQIEIQKEAQTASSQDFLSEDAPSISLNKGPSAVNQWVANFLASRTISKGKKSGGTFILKGYRDTGVELVWSKTPVRYVKFIVKNEKGEPLEYITRVVKTKHRWKGSSIPVHVALEGVNENVDLFEGAEVELSAEYVNKALTLQWNAGLLTGLAMRDEEAGDLFKKIQPILLIIILVVVCVMVYMMYTMYSKIDALDVGAIKSFVEIARSQASNVNVTVG